VNLGPVVNGSSYDRGPCISAEGLELYFDSRRSGGCGLDDIWVATRKTISDPWEAPVNLGPAVNSPQLDSQPSLSADGLSLYFRSSRKGGYGSTDIWVARRKSLSSSWDTPINLGPTVNSSSGEDDPSVSADGLSLYFGSNRPGGYGGSDLWITRRIAIDEPWGEVENLGVVINSRSVEMLPCISPDGLSLFFQSNRPRGNSSSDIWVATRVSLDDPWQEPANLGSAVNGSGLQGDVSLSPDGSMLYFGSKRPGGAGDFDLWQVPILPTVDSALGGLVDVEP
jgi:Tol biopolymer transport system component